jgi:hypothetical protein
MFARVITAQAGAEGFDEVVRLAQHEISGAQTCKAAVRHRSCPSAHAHCCLSFLAGVRAAHPALLRSASEEQRG